MYIYIFYFFIIIIFCIMRPKDDKISFVAFNLYREIDTVCLRSLGRGHLSGLLATRGFDWRRRVCGFGIT